MFKTAGNLFCWIAVMALCAIPATASAQTPESQDVIERAFDRDCMDDYGRDLCDREVWAAIVASFGVEPAEQPQQQGWRGTRVFLIDGYSRDMPMVSVLRKGEDEYALPADMVLEVRGAGDPGSEGARPVLHRRGWLGLDRQSINIQNLVTKAPVRQSDGAAASAEEGDEIVLCLHAWVAVTESLTDQGVERRIRNACGDDPLFDAGYEMSAQALRGFPHCNHLEPGAYRNESTQLQACLTLQGEDKVAAAEVLSLIDGPPFYSGWGSLASHLSEDVQLALPDGRRIEGATRVAEALTSQSELGSRYVSRVIGGSGRVEAVGEFWRYGEVTDYAEYEQTWERIAGRWRMTAMTVGQFVPAPARTD